MNKTVLGVVTVCAGAPLLALGVGTATAWADTNPTSPNTHATAQAAKGGGLAISVGGIKLVQTGNSTAQTLGPNLAIAFNNSSAVAAGLGSVAIATNKSGAEVTGILSSAIAGNNSQASSFGTGNISIAQNGSTAEVDGGPFNRGIATNNSSVTVNYPGGNNTVTARCGGSVVFGGQSNKIITSAPCKAG
jgi:hypothetical protein